MACIYVASKENHAPMWRALRDANVPIVSSWIAMNNICDDDDLEWENLWLTCIEEAAASSAVIAYVAPGEHLEGAMAMVGAALAVGVRVYAVGVCKSRSWQHHPGVTVCDDLADAITQALKHSGHLEENAMNWEAIREVVKEAAQSGPSHVPTEPPDTGDDT